MAVSADYPNPVQVNGYRCKNCTDVDYAKKHIDPAHPKDGPYGISKAEQPPRAGDPPSVTLGGLLSGVAVPSTAAAVDRAQGGRLEVYA